MLPFAIRAAPLTAAPAMETGGGQRELIVLTAGEYSYYHIVGVFSSEEKARQYAALMDKDGEFSYESYVLNERSADTWQPVYWCQIDLDGNVIDQETHEPQLKPQRWSEVSDGRNYSYSTFSAKSVVSADHALKLCAEQRQDWLRRYPLAKFHRWAVIKPGKPLEITKHWHGYTEVSDPHGHIAQYGQVHCYKENPLDCSAISVVSAEDAVRLVMEIAKKHGHA